MAILLRAVLLLLRFGLRGLSAALNKTVSLQCILSTEAFVAIIARERLDCEMYPLMPL